ncbi:MAG: ABC transporter permease [Chloroflexi bacterium]|nr:ABC transporter permease [Chloroflexota bacterium]
MLRPHSPPPFTGNSVCVPAVSAWCPRARSNWLRAATSTTLAMLRPGATGILFIGFGIWTLRGDKVEDEEADKGMRFGPILAATIAVSLIVGAQFIEALRAIAIPWSMFLTLAVFFVPTYALISGMMIAVGSMVTETRQGQQISGAISMLFTLPFFFMVVFFSAPNSPLATILTIFPTTSFLTIALRWGMTTIPLWEMIVGWVLVTASAVFMVWAASRIFRLGMLQYGQRLDVKSMLHAVRTGREG